MSGKALFFKRFREQLRYHLSIWKSVFDWTIVLYLAVPGAIFLGIIYSKAWDDISHYWSTSIPFSVLAGLLLLLSTGGNYRTYLLEADLLHLIQRKTILSELKLCALVGSLLFSTVQVIAMIVLSLPILELVYGFNKMDYVLLAALLLGYRLSYLTVKKVLYRSWKMWLILIPIFIAAFVSLTILPPIVYGLLGISIAACHFLYQYAQFRKTNRWFLKEIEIESEELTKPVRLIYQFSPDIEKLPGRQRKRPWFLFRHSRRLFTIRNDENGLLEILLKTFLRTPAHFSSYLQLSGITAAAILVTPLWIKWLIFGLYFLFIPFWLSSLYQKLMNDEFFTVVPVKEETKESVMFRFRRILALPSQIGLGILILIVSFL